MWVESRRGPFLELRKVGSWQSWELFEKKALAALAVCQTSGDWSIHDVSEAAEKEQERTARVIADEIVLRALLDKIRSSPDIVVSAPQQVLDEINACLDS